MFEDMLHLDHGELVARVIEVVSQVDPMAVAGAFLASLTSRRLDLRSALGSYAVARHLGEHDFALRTGHLTCGVCDAYADEDDLDRNILNVERFKWGGVRRDDLTYVWHDLDLFARCEPPQPTGADRALFAELLDALDGAPPGTTGANAHKLLRALPGNPEERSALIDILGVCSIMETPEHTGHADRFVPAAERDLPPLSYVERTYPACWWKAEHGVNREAARRFHLT